jgi:hypothetical protein
MSLTRREVLAAPLVAHAVTAFYFDRPAPERISHGRFP